MNDRREFIERTYPDNWYDYVVECEQCHDLYFGNIQLYSEREVEIVKSLLTNLFTGDDHVAGGCIKCGAKDFIITVSNKYLETLNSWQRKSE